MARRSCRDRDRCVQRAGRHPRRGHAQFAKCGPLIRGGQREHFVARFKPTDSGVDSCWTRSTPRARVPIDTANSWIGPDGKYRGGYLRRYRVAVKLHYRNAAFAAILASMSAVAQIRVTPFDEYLALESSSDIKHEWIGGLIYAMSRGTPEHGRLSAAIVRALPQTSDCRVYSSDTLLYIENAQHSTYADASIVCGAILTRGAKDKNGKSLGEAITNPRVVVEVLSKSTEQRDRNERFALFQQLDSLEEYVLVSQDERCIEVRRRSDRTWHSETKRAGETIRIHGLDIAIDDIYG